MTSGACDFVYGGYAWIKLLRMAKRIRLLKLRKSIFRMMWLRWLSTVRVETPIIAAAS
jgi:hypothetical protein